jgi:hypothetical protein
MTTSIDAFDEVVKVIGFNGALAMAAVHGNSTLFIPKGHMSDAHHLVQLLGRALAERLQKEWPSLELSVPAFSTFNRLRSLAIVWDLHKQKYTNQEIAFLTESTLRSVQMYIKQAKKIKPKYKQRGTAWVLTRKNLDSKHINVKELTIEKHVVDQQQEQQQVKKTITKPTLTKPKNARGPSQSQPPAGDETCDSRLD